MRKLFSILSTIFSILPSKSIFSKKDKNDKITDPLLFGTDIDKSFAKKSSGNYKYKITNFFVIGDSLSDVNGLTTCVADRLKKSKINISLKVHGEAYGFLENEKHFSCFSNGPTAAFIVAKKLGLESFEASNPFSVRENEYGKNYAIAGSTSGELKGPSGGFLNAFTVEMQTRALISQHIIEQNDIVFFEIGGNDLGSMVSVIDNEKEVEEFIADSIKRLRVSLFSLLNNGIKKILFMTPPSMKYPPRFNHIFSDEEQKNKQEAILKMCENYHKLMLETIEEVNQYYPKKVVVFDLFNEFENIQKKWLKKHWFKNKKIAKANIDTSYTSWDTIITKVKLKDGEYEIKNLKEFNGLLFKIAKSVLRSDAVIEIDIKSGNPTTNQPIENSFFVDNFHPNKVVHEMVAKTLLKQIKKITKHW